MHLNVRLLTVFLEHNCAADVCKSRSYCSYLYSMNHFFWIFVNYQFLVQVIADLLLLYFSLFQIVVSIIHLFVGSSIISTISTIIVAVVVSATIDVFILYVEAPEVQSDPKNTMSCSFIKHKLKNDIDL